MNRFLSNDLKDWPAGLTTMCNEVDARRKWTDSNEVKRRRRRDAIAIRSVRPPRAAAQQPDDMKNENERILVLRLRVAMSPRDGNEAKDFFFFFLFHSRNENENGTLDAGRGMGIGRHRPTKPTTTVTTPTSDTEMNDGACGCGRCNLQSICRAMRRQRRAKKVQHTTGVPTPPPPFHPAKVLLLQCARASWVCFHAAPEKCAKEPVLDFGSSPRCTVI